jgi:hypothetical protein
VQMRALMSSRGIGVAAALLAIVCNCIWCGASGVYWEIRAMADARGMS